MGEPRTGTVLFVCRCGPNIADFVDLDEVVAWAEQRDDIDEVFAHDLLCAPDGMKTFKECLDGRDPEGIVVAACSPKQHEKTFQDLAEEVGINISRVQMANIREHCAWVTQHKDQATDKAKALVNAGLHRVRHAEPLERRSMEVLSDVLVIGGGLAGIEAALTAAKAGRKVTLVEHEISVGGSVIRTEEVAPNMECSPCLLAPRLSALNEADNIEVIANAEVTAVRGFYGNFTVETRQEPRYVKDNCIGCEACFEVCPVDVKSSFHLGLGTHKAVYTLFPGSVPAAAAIDAEHCLHFRDGSCSECVPACPFESIDFEEQATTREIEVGAIVIATGFAPGDVSAFEALGHGAVTDVYTLPEFERLASSNGPHGGTILRADGEAPASVAVVHCAGSLRDGGIPYCSGTCCLEAFKVGQMLRHQVPEAKVFNVYGDLVLPGPKERRFAEQARRDGTRMLRCGDLARVSVSRSNGKVQVIGPGFAPLDVDMVVLATGMGPAAGTGALAEMMHLDRDEDGFLKADHDILHATGSALDGIYLAGCAAGPCNVATSVARGKAAVGDAISKLVPGREIELEVMTSCIDEEVCAGCKLCITTCPYGAITYEDEKTVCVINEAICRGCGTCTATCPSGASTAKHFTDAQIYAEIGGLIGV